MTALPRSWLPAALAFAVGCLAFLLVPEDSAASVAIFQAVAVAAVVVLLVSVMHLPRGARTVWWWVLAYAVLSDMGDIAFDVQDRLLDEPPYPGPADVFYLTAYLAALVALGLIIRRSRASGGTDVWIDAAIIAVGIASVVGVLVIEPILLDSQEPTLSKALSLAYPLLDLLLLAGLGRLLVGRDRANPAIALLSLAFLVTFVADLLFSYLASTGLEGAAPAGLDVLYLAAYAVLALAASAPGAAGLTSRPPSDEADARLQARPTSSTAVALAIGAVTVPAMLVYATWSGSEADLVLLSLACIAVVALVLWRFRRLLRIATGQSDDLALLARTDALTGLPNRRTLDFEMERQESTAREQETPLCIAMLDLDHFKPYNDTHGHQAGDEALVACSSAWRAALGSRAFLARYGGEEFAALLPGHDLDGARHLLESARRSTPGGLTVSIGVAQWRPGETAVDAMLRADRALYRAKDLGRDRVVVAEDEPSA